MVLACADSGYSCGNFIGVPFAKYYSSLGKKINDKTEGLKCPQVDYVSVALREVATCYENSGNFDKALLQLKFIKNDDLLSSCSSEEERAQLLKQISDTRKPVN